jgi:hypothetical protein
VLVPERVRTDEELCAAFEIIRFAGDDGTILPLSSAHLLETSGLHGDRRYEVGVTIASFSSGWQMRHPWNVFEQEAIEALASRMGHTTTIETDRPVVTTEPNAWMQRTSSMGLGPRPKGSMELFFSMLNAPSVIVQQLIEPQAGRRTPITTWVNSHERITRQFKALKASKDKKRAVARRRFWNENVGMYRQALAKVFGTVDFPTFSDRELRILLAEGSDDLSDQRVVRYSVHRSVDEVDDQRLGRHVLPLVRRGLLPLRRRRGQDGHAPAADSASARQGG